MEDAVRSAQKRPIRIRFIRMFAPPGFSGEGGGRREQVALLLFADFTSPSFHGGHCKD